ncbi:MAG: 30S ribosomal protein S8 [Salinibacterium sp.]|nr:30S ribosomal protein S8 [Planctomycetota bacterium]MCB1281847.1 30S ribosomal protein S8 [Salinibacterium sp.]
MSMTDPIADMLTRIRNANSIKRKTVDVPMSKLKLGIAEALKRSGFVTDYRVLEAESPKDRLLRINLKYGPDGEFVINEIKRFSRPGCRVYRGVEELPRVLDGLGICILSTSRGILNDAEARDKNIGGEVLATVW